MRPSVISRNGDVVTLEAQSKEALHLAGHGLQQLFGFLAGLGPTLLALSLISFLACPSPLTVNEIMANEVTFSFLAEPVRY
mgnify:CR=1 FL=1